MKAAIVGGGISGLAAAYELKRRQPSWSLAVLEKEGVAGGKVRSSVAEGFTFDWGPNGFLDNAPATLSLVEGLGLAGLLRSAAPAAGKRYLFRAGGLRPLPTKPQAFLASELLSPVGKLRVLLEPLLARPVAREETVYDFVARHFGREAARALAEPMVLGVAAGDARRLSLDALFPAMRRLEAEHGSLLRGMAASRRSGRGGPGRLTSFEGGMGSLTSALAGSLGGALVTGAEVVALELRAAGGFTLRLADGREVAAERVALTAPAFVSARLLAPLLPEGATELAAISYPDVDVFALGFHRVDVPHPLDGFGFLAPRGEGVRSLGTLWSSSLFAGRAPEGRALLRVIAGGSLDPAFSALGDDEALESVRRDLRLTLGITEPPLFWRRIRWPRAIPQYELGHRARVERALAAARGLPGLVLGGNGLHGVAVNDCIRDAGRVAAELDGGAAAT